MMNLTFIIPEFVKNLTIPTKKALVDRGKGATSKGL